MKEETKKRKIQKIIIWILIAGWMLVIFLFSSQNGDESSKLSQGFLRKCILWFLPDHMNGATVDTLEYIVRKCAHMTEYAVLGILISIQFRLYRFFEKEWKTISAAIFFVMMYAATDEIHQLFIGGRSGRFTDVLIDTCGGMIGALAVYFTCKLKNLRKSENGGKR